MNYKNQKNGIKRLTDQIQGNAIGITRKIELRYGVLGGYTPSEIKQIAESLVSINNRLLNIRRKL